MKKLVFFIVVLVFVIANIKINVTSKNNYFDYKGDMNFSEIVDIISKEKNISKEKAIQDLVKRNIVNGDSRDKIINQLENSNYWVFTEKINQNTSLKFLCRVSSSKHYIGIYDVLDIFLNSDDREFEGEYYHNLENEYTIYWEVNGGLSKNRKISFADIFELKLDEFDTKGICIDGKKRILY